MTETASPVSLMATFADAEEALATSLPGYESRPQQQLLARSIEQAFATETHLIGQAGCGTGKSLGYLIPLILSGKRGVVSVTTKALQTQLAEKDLPFLQTHLGVPFTWAVLKGRSNYYCAARAATAEAFPLLSRVLEFADTAEGFAGEREDFPFEIPAVDWYKVCSDTDECRDLGCKSRTLRDLIQPDYAELAKERAKNSRVVVTNHAMFCIDLYLSGVFGNRADEEEEEDVRGGGPMLDKYDVLILDEAHEFEDVVRDSLTHRFSPGAIRSLVTQIRNWADRYADDAEKITEPGRQVAVATEALWAQLKPGRIYQRTVLDNQDEFVALSLALDAMAEALTKMSYDRNCPVDDRQRCSRRKSELSRNARQMHQRFTTIIAGDWTNVVRWVEEETDRRGLKRLVLNTAPIDVDDYLRERLFSVTPTVLVSATLSVAGRFDHVSGRLGIDDYEGIDVGTPFDFTNQARLYVPMHLPEPTQANIRNWETQSREEILDLVKASNGRALVLFTSVKHMRDTYAAIKDRLPYTLMMQGEAPPKVLAERFMADTHSVLFGTKSFFTGVDFQGEACSLVIITKLPFPVPTEPMTEAITDKIKRAGGNDFSEYTIPVMTLVLQQAFGRLIRHRNDTGVVAILDPRLVSKGYAKPIRASLPQTPVLSDIAGVRGFYAEVDREPAG